jgi:methyltransferase
LILARANRTRLHGHGAVEIDRAGYKWFIVLHAAWLAALGLIVPAAEPPRCPLLALFILLQTALTRF